MKVEFNTQAFKDIRYGRTSEIVGVLEEAAETVADRARSEGEGQYEVGSRPGQARPQGRHRTSVVTADAKAMIETARHNVLLRALG